MGSSSRMERLSKPARFLGFLLFLPIPFASLAGCHSSNIAEHATAESKPAQRTAFNLGRIWKVEEGYYDDPHWIGVWTRRGDTNVFDATWKHCWMNQTARDEIEVQSAKDGQVVVFRRGVNQCYRGTYSPEHPNKLRGKGDWFGPDLIWRAEIEY